MRTSGMFETMFLWRVIRIEAKKTRLFFRKGTFPFFRPLVSGWNPSPSNYIYQLLTTLVGTPTPFGWSWLVRLPPSNQSACNFHFKAQKSFYIDRENTTSCSMKILYWPVGNIVPAVCSMNPNIKITGDSGITFAEKNDGEHPISRQLEKVNVFGKLPSFLTKLYQISPAFLQIFSYSVIFDSLLLVGISFHFFTFFFARLIFYDLLLVESDFVSRNDRIAKLKET